MTDFQLIDGKSIAESLRFKIGNAVKNLKQQHDITPGLAVVLVGDDPASQVYVRNKIKQTRSCGMESFEFKLAANTSQEYLLTLLHELNNRNDINGILVQLPLPAQLDANEIVQAIDPQKDVDGLHPVNAGLLAMGQKGLIPCTPLGCIKLIGSVHADMTGMHAVIIGRSHLVGKPLVQLLLTENCTVTIAHSKTRNLPELARSADILVAAVGVPHLVKDSWVKPGATVIDVGINRVDAPEKGPGKTRLVGDVDFDAACKIAGAITPVPGGAGPMTIACLLNNTLQAATGQNGLDMPVL